MDIAPSLPAVTGADDGAVTVYSSSYARRIIATAVEQMGGADGLVSWARSAPDRTDQFWTKIFPKIVVKQVEVSDTRSVEDVIDMLDAGEAVSAPSAAEMAVDAEFEDHYD